jgi:hypothetical protein
MSQGPRPGDPHWRAHDPTGEELLLTAEAEDLIAFLKRIPELREISRIKPIAIIPLREDQRTFLEVFATQNEYQQSLILDFVGLDIAFETFLQPHAYLFFFYSRNYLNDLILAVGGQVDFDQAIATIRTTQVAGSVEDDFVRMAMGPVEPQMNTERGREIYNDWKALRVAH